MTRRRLALRAVTALAFVSALSAHPAGAAIRWGPGRDLAPATRTTSPLSGIAAGAPVVAWLDPVETLVRFSAGSWALPTAAPNEALFAPGLFADAAGTATLVRLVAGPVIEAATRPLGGAFPAPGAGDALSAGGTAPTWKVDPSGWVAAAWFEGGDLRAARRPPGGPWEQLGAAVAGASDVGAVQLDVQDDGAVVVGWERASAAVQAAVRPAAGPWAAAATLAPSATSVKVAVDDAGRATAAWTDGPGAVRLATADAAGGWTTPAVAVQPAAMRAADVDLDAAGTLTVAAWRAQATSGPALQSISTAIGQAGAWEQQGDAGCATGDDRVALPFIAVDADGTTVVAWRATTSDAITVRAAIAAPDVASNGLCAADPDPAPPSPPPGPTRPATPPAPPLQAPGATSRLGLRLPPQTLATIRRRGELRAICRMPGPGTCTVTAHVDAATARALGLRGRRLARAVAVYTDAGGQTVRLALSRPVIRRLRRVRVLRATITVRTAGATRRAVLVAR